MSKGYGPFKVSRICRAREVLVLDDILGITGVKDSELKHLDEKDFEIMNLKK